MLHRPPGKFSILLVHERFPPDYGGGGEYVVLQLAKQLIASGHHVKVLTTGDPAQDNFEGVPLKRLRVSRYRFNLTSAQVAQAAAEFGADLIHCFSYHSAYPAWNAARLLGTPVFLGVLALFGDAWLQMRGPVAGRLFRWYEMFLMRMPFDQRFFLSHGSLELARTLKAAQARDLVIAPGISLEDYRCDHHKDGVLFAGKFDSRKGIATVQQLARELPHIPFLAIGWGPEFDRVAANSPPNLVAERFSDRQRLAAALAASRIFLFPSQVETFGLAVAEAMASGCAVVSSAPIRFEGARVDPDNIPAIREALERLWHDLPLCRECGSRNQSLAQAYTWARHIVQLEAAYGERIGRPRRGPSPTIARQQKVAQ